MNLSRAAVIVLKGPRSRRPAACNEALSEDLVAFWHIQPRGAAAVSQPVFPATAPQPAWPPQSWSQPTWCCCPSACLPPPTSSALLPSAGGSGSCSSLHLLFLSVFFFTYLFWEEEDVQLAWRLSSLSEAPKADRTYRSNNLNTWPDFEHGV